MADVNQGATADTSPDLAQRSLAERIEWLIQNRWPADAPGPRNNVEAAAAIQKATGEEISSTTVWKLRTGRADNPQLKTLKALSAYFRVPIGFFGDPDEFEPIADQLAMRALADSPVNREVIRALAELSDESRELVTEMVLSAARAERVRRERRG